MLKRRLVVRIEKVLTGEYVARQRAIALASWPLLDNNPKIVELLDRGFEVTSHPGAIFCTDPGSLRRSRSRVHTSTRPAGSVPWLRQGPPDQLHFLAAGSLRAQHRSLTDRAWIGIGEHDPQSQRIGTHREKGIGPCGGFVHVDVETLRRQGNAGKNGALLSRVVALACADAFACCSALTAPLATPTTACSCLWQAIMAASKSRPIAANLLNFEWGLTLKS